MGKYDKGIFTMGKQPWTNALMKDRTYQTKDLVQYGEKYLPNPVPAFAPHTVLKEFK